MWVLIEAAVEEIGCGGVSAQGGSHIAHILALPLAPLRPSASFQEVKLTLPFPH